VFELVDTYSQNAVIKVMGIGGGGVTGVLLSLPPPPQAARNKTKISASQGLRRCWRWGWNGWVNI